MPTGYTAAIKDGISFEEFALGCARAFGALVTMRDEPSDAEIPDSFEPSDYHAKMLEEAKNRLHYLQCLSLEDAGILAEQQHKDESARLSKRLEENSALMASYRAMLEQAKAWTPPSSDHVNLKEFMVGQIEESIRFDDCSEYCEPPPKKSGEQWRADQIKAAEWSVSYHEKEHKAEVARCKERTEWVKDLRSSLKA